MDDTSSLRKRQRISNQIISNIIPESCSTLPILAIDGKMIFECPSRDSLTQHKIIIEIIDNSLKFKCDCSGAYDCKPTGHCIHLTSTIIFLFHTFIHKSVEFMDEKDKYLYQKKQVKELETMISSMHIDDKK
jgi:hypothetical protein